MSATIVKVAFQGDELPAFERDGKRFVVLRPVVDRLGLGLGEQLKKLRSKHWANVSVVESVGRDGKRRKMVAVDEQTLDRWLADLEPSRMGEAAAERLWQARGHGASAPLRAKASSRVYCAVDEASRAIKIGVSRCVKKRMRDLSTGPTARVRLVAHWDGWVREERALHDELGPYRIRLEWFEPHPAVLAAVKREASADRRVEFGPRKDLLQ